MQTVSAKGATIPALGFGTYLLKGGEARRMTEYALSIGYRHIDTAQMYGNETDVGAGITASSVPRDEIFLTTKVWPDQFRDGDLQKAAADSLKKLATDAVDLLLLHWPNPQIPLAETIGALNDVKNKGMAKHIGISNFTTPLMAEAIGLSDAPLVVNQVEYHPYLSQATLLKALRQQDMALTAYSPLARGSIAKDKTLQTIAADHGKTAGQVALRWFMQQPQVSAIPKAASEAHAQANLAIFDFALSETEMALISALANPSGRLVDPTGMAPAWDED